ncbi:MAG: hypothetical protein CVU42_05085 [Chloroflexi bacterium HGW-Chloroflexi-4]|jgi:transcriptional regulator with XRE-family HTH domain|nr:MAG: hypothetical protein CVU42_05085 [Chloroflexi bacterium HGW-Chloroflexi-4]
MDPKELGRQVLAKRKENGWSQEKLGEMADISRNYVSLIERGEADSISIKVINKLATAFGVSPSSLGEAQSSPLVMIPPSLRDFARQNSLSFDITEKLANLPKRGREPQSVEDWQKLYEVIKDFFDGDFK